ncbi:TetR/AcrR family transcriptional regulator [Nesterenkonia haasae]|uniref:TetR/AcrR family transcriptional regulator n=1 Tax=Nesterenkonia haasae TaxID=2587813 RepID=UPI001390CC60|nr:TetR/AcrR family transcriptional regulator C-terminal domain-containing protein [Nesterenkonia haasae]NDK30258.1 TetR family transcriptional regulator [Nesterenkonia haasae]
MAARDAGSGTVDEDRAGRTGRRGQRLNRNRLLETALHIVDQHGVDALTMRRIATELQVDPMTIYRHVKNKDALLDGVVEQLWSQVWPQGPDSEEWKAVLSHLGRGLRDVMMRHPSAGPLLLSRPVLPGSALVVLKHALDVVKDAGFTEQEAATIVRCVSSVALSDSALRVTYELPQRPHNASGEPDPEQLISLTQLLPPDTPPDLVRVAWTICPPLETDDDFGFTLDLIVAGAEHLRNRA